MPSTVISATIDLIKFDITPSTSLGFSECLSLELNNQVILETLTITSNEYIPVDITKPQVEVIIHSADDDKLNTMSA